VNGPVVVYRRVDYLHGFAFEAVGDLLERPSLLVLDRALEKLLAVLSLNSFAALIIGRAGDEIVRLQQPIERRLGDSILPMRLT
jgi:hypothetical protein